MPPLILFISLLTRQIVDFAHSMAILQSYLSRIFGADVITAEAADDGTKSLSVRQGERERERQRENVRIWHFIPKSGVCQPGSHEAGARWSRHTLSSNAAAESRRRAGRLACKPCERHVG
jgi:hypothetical protein